MELSADQQQVVAHDCGAARVVGGAGTGKTTALVHRYLRLVAFTASSRVLVLCRHRAAAGRFRDAALRHLAGGFDALAVTTAHGLAFDVLRRAGREVRLLGRAEQWGVVRRLLVADVGDPSRWPTLHALIGRRAFADEVSAAVLHLQSSMVAPEEVLARATSSGTRDRWQELLAFVGRYHDELDRRGVLDPAGLLVAAVHVLERADVASRPVEHVLVDDYEGATPAVERLLAAMAAQGAGVTVAGNPDAAIGAGQHQSPDFLEGFATRFESCLDLTLTTPFRPPVPGETVVCRHPAVEAEAVAGELLAAHGEGVPWSEMAVLVRHPGRRGRAVARGLARHGIPVGGTVGGGDDEPVVRAVLDLFRWACGDEGAVDRLLASPLAGLDPADVRSLRREARAGGVPLEAHPRVAPLVALRDDVEARLGEDDPAALAHLVVRRALAHLVPDPSRGVADVADERAIDALVAFVTGLQRQVDADPGLRVPEYLARVDGPDAEPGPWQADAHDGGDAVTITTIAGAVGREWHTVVVAGAVEGELPHIQAHVAFFDVAILEGADPPPRAERRRRSRAEERRLFGVATARARARLVATAAPEPGVALSPFVEAWEQRGPDLPLAPGRPARIRPPTAGVVPVWPEGRLRLSASQLDTYADCPLRYAYTYALRVRGDPGVQADLGSLVHGVLAEFLDPTSERGRTRERLVEIAEAHWRDDIARFRPQVEEARRDYFSMLETWWEREGEVGPAGLEVLAVEHRFTIDVGPHQVVGAIDRVDRADDGVGIRVVDYKTGRSEPRADEMADNLQLATYHLAATRDPQLTALGRPSQLRLLFLRSMRAHDQPVTDGHAAATEARILAAADGILAERFEPSVDAECRWCDFQRLCPLWPEGREVGEG